MNYLIFNKIDSGKKTNPDQKIRAGRIRKKKEAPRARDEPGVAGTS